MKSGSPDDGLNLSDLIYLTGRRTCRCSGPPKSVRNGSSRRPYVRSRSLRVRESLLRIPSMRLVGAAAQTMIRWVVLLSSERETECCWPTVSARAAAETNSPMSARTSSARPMKASTSDFRRPYSCALLCSRWPGRCHEDRRRCGSPAHLSGAAYRPNGGKPHVSLGARGFADDRSKDARNAILVLRELVCRHAALRGVRGVLAVYDKRDAVPGMDDGDVRVRPRLELTQVLADQVARDRLHRDDEDPVTHRTSWSGGHPCLRSGFSAGRSAGTSRRRPSRLREPGGGLCRRSGAQSLHPRMPHKVSFIRRFEACRTGASAGRCSAVLTGRPTRIFGDLFCGGLVSSLPLRHDHWRPSVGYPAGRMS
jgi:hypothetical protein